MTIVWILSYLAVFMFGGIAMFAAFYFSVNNTEKQIERLMDDPYNYETNEKSDPHTDIELIRPL